MHIGYERVIALLRLGGLLVGFICGMHCRALDCVVLMGQGHCINRVALHNTHCITVHFASHIRHSCIQINVV